MRLGHAFIKWGARVRHLENVADCSLPQHLAARSGHLAVYMALLSNGAEETDKCDCLCFPKAHDYSSYRELTHSTDEISASTSGSKTWNATWTGTASGIRTVTGTSSSSSTSVSNNVPTAWSAENELEYLLNGSSSTFPTPSVSTTSVASSSSTKSKSSMSLSPLKISPEQTAAFGASLHLPIKLQLPRDYAIANDHMSFVKMYTFHEQMTELPRLLAIAVEFGASACVMELMALTKAILTQGSVSSTPHATPHTDTRIHHSPLTTYSF